MGEWLRRLWYLANRARLEAALRHEMEAHRAMMRDPARFGNTLRLREESRDQWGWRWLDDIVRDLRFSVRALRRTPSFTAVAVASLTLGLALVAVTVSVVNAYLLRALPYPQADRLYHVMYAPPGPWEPAGMTGLDWKSVDDVVEFPIGSAGDTFYMSEGGRTMTARGLRVSPGFQDALGVRAIVGRPFTPDDFHAAAEPVALVGHSFWRDRLGADPGVVGRLLRVEGETRAGQAETFRIAGVLPAGFYYGRHSGDTVDLLMPLTSPVRVYMVRLREGVPTAAAERRLTQAARRAATSAIPGEWTGVKLESAYDRYVGDARPVLIGVTAAACLVLVIVCANLTVLIVLRAVQRQKEMAVRVALGAGRRHIVRMALVETILVCAAASGAAVALAAVTVGGLAPLVESQLGRPAPHGASAIAIDGTVLLVVGALSTLIALMLSCTPLMSAWGQRFTAALRQDGRVASDSASMRRVRSVLIALEVAGALILLVGCGLMVRSVIGIIRTDLGLETADVVRTRIVLRARNYEDAAAYQRFYMQFAERATVVTGSPVVFTNWPPFVTTPTQLVETGPGGASAHAGVLGVSAGYFSMFRVSIRQGREFAEADVSSGQPVAIVSATLAQRLWPGDSAIGRQVRGVVETQGGPTPGPWRTVVGVAADVRQTYDDGDRSDLYTPMLPEGRYGSFYMHARGPVRRLYESLVSAAALDPEAILHEPRPVADEDRTRAATTFLTGFLSVFAALAVLLAMLGIYGVTAYVVRQREKEIAIRVALGASERAVVRMFLRGGAVLLGAGTMVGLIGSVGMARVLQGYVVGVQPFDASTQLAACGLLLGAGFLAVWWPARRAAARNPARALSGT